MEPFYLAATVVAGRVQLADPDDYKMRVAELEEGLRLVVGFEEEGERRTVQANRYLWQIYTWIEAETGQPKDSIHAEMCRRFLTKRAHYTDKKTGLTVDTEYVSGSSGLTPKQFHEFVENVRLHAAEWHQMTIPDPDPAYRRERARVLKESQ